MNVALIDLCLLGVRRESHDGVGPRRSVAYRQHLQPSNLGALAGAAARMQSDADFHAAVTQVQRMRMALRPVPDNSDLRGSKQRKVGVLVIKDLCHCVSSPAKNLV